MEKGHLGEKLSYRSDRHADTEMIRLQEAQRNRSSVILILPFFDMPSEDTNLHFP